jgi:hypothetical protein
MFRATAVRLLATVFLLGIVCGCTMWRQKKPNTWQTATSADQYERILWNEVKARRMEVVRRKLASSFVFTGPEGTLNRDQYVQELTRMHVTSYSITNVAAQPNGPDWVVSYTLTVTGNAGAFPSGPMHVMTVWQQAGSQWIAIAQAVVPQSAAASATPAK